MHALNISNGMNIAAEIMSPIFKNSKYISSPLFLVNDCDPAQASFSCKRTVPGSKRYLTNSPGASIANNAYWFFFSRKQDDGICPFHGSTLFHIRQKIRSLLTFILLVHAYKTDFLVFLFWGSKQYFQFLKIRFFAGIYKRRIYDSFKHFLVFYVGHFLSVDRIAYRIIPPNKLLLHIGASHAC